MPAHAAKLMEVAVARLDVGDGPDGPSGSIVLTAATLQAGALVWIVETTEHEGDQWHLVAGEPGLDELAIPFGWVAASIDGGMTLRRPDLDCPEGPLSVEQSASLGGLGRLACYGDTPIDLIGFTPLGCGAGGSPRTGTPDWLNGTWSGLGIGDREPVPPDFKVDSSIIARVAPAANVRAGCAQPGWFRFRGHHDDPASATCRTETVDGLAMIAVEPRISELLCRTSFVINDALPMEGPP